MNAPSVKAEPSTSADRRWKFANVAFDERSLDLIVDGASVEIERKPLEVLRFLLQHAGEVVTKDELLAAVWPGRVLSETVLTKAIARLREQLGPDGQATIKTVHGYGYRLVAPVTAEVTRAAPTTHFGFKAGDHPPLRPLWSLVERLGSGGHGEVWLVRHDKTREQRVFKFALDESSLVSLKREITLFRVLQESLGGKARLVTLRDWNLEQVPYFIESDFARQGSLVDWWERSGGSDSISLDVRVEIVARIAEALAAIHAVGVLHKDMKPSNILIDRVVEGYPEILLGDLGSGGLLDPARLASMGITRLGFTQTVAAAAGGTGTPLYLAPELLKGQPPTVLSDIYALGVLLFQLVVGDLRRPLYAGWERDIQDALLREDIAAAAEGVPEHRLFSAADLATRLRSLDSRRGERQRQVEEQRALERQKLSAERAKARRVASIVAVAFLLIGLITSALLYMDARRARAHAEAESIEAKSARARAESERATAQAVASFLGEEMFQGFEDRPLQGLEINDLLTAAAKKLPERLAGSPAAAEQINASLGAAFVRVESFQAALPHLRSALSYFERVEGSGSANAMRVAHYLLFAEAQLENSSNFPRYDELVRIGGDRLGQGHSAVLLLRRDLAQFRMGMEGTFAQSEKEFSSILALAKREARRDEELIGYTQMLLGQSQTRLGLYREAERVLLDSIEMLRTLHQSSHISVAHALQLHALALIELGRFEEAKGQMVEANKIVNEWDEREGSIENSSVQYPFAFLLLRQGKFDKAAENLLQLIKLHTGQGMSPAQTIEARVALTQSYLHSGQLSLARESAKIGADIAQNLLKPTDPFGIHARLVQAEVALKTSDVHLAQGVLRHVSVEALNALGDMHPLRGYFHRLTGLLASVHHEPGTATRELRRAFEIYRARYSEGDIRVSQVKSELGLLGVSDDL